MAFENCKITDKEIEALNVKSAKDTYNATNVQENKNIFDRLPEHIAAKLNLLVDEIIKLQGEVVSGDDVTQMINQRIIDLNTGDMAKSVYDSNNSGVVDNSERLGGFGAEHFATAAQMAGFTQSISAMVVADTLPENPDPNTLYLIPK